MKDGRVVRQELVTISRDGREVVTVGIEPPPSESPVPTAPATTAESPGIEPEETWLTRVLTLPHNERFQAVVERLKVINPEFHSKILRYEFTGDDATIVFMLDSNLSNISPIKAFPKLRRLTVRETSLVDFSPIADLPLISLDAVSSQIADLRPLAKMPLERLILRRTPVQDLSPLADTPLRYLAIEYTPVRDLTPLQGMKLESLLCADSKVTDLTPLAGMPLRELAVAGLRLSDLRPLTGMKLTTLYLDRSDVSDLSPIAGMPLTRLTLGGLPGIDLKHLEGMPLEELWLDFDLDRDGPFLRTLKSLRKLNGKPVSEMLP